MGLKLGKTCIPPPPGRVHINSTKFHRNWANSIGTDFLLADSIALCITEHYYLPADRNLYYLSSTSISSLMLYSLSKTGIKFPKEK